MAELCGELTPTGESCNMPKGHSAPFHRYRKYRGPAKWTIMTVGDRNILEEGTGRKELGYAMTNWLKKSIPILVAVYPGDGQGMVLDTLWYGSPYQCGLGSLVVVRSDRYGSAYRRLVE